MVSLLSLFGGKKRQKSSAVKQSSTTGSPAAPLDNDRAGHGPQRFLTARSRSSQKPYETNARHSSAEASSKKSASKQKAYQLPQLDLGLVTGPDGPDAGSSEPVFALRDVTSVPHLSDEELRGMDSLRFSARDVACGWSLLSTALRQRGYDDQRLLQPNLERQDQLTQRYILALLVLSIKPDLATTLPTVDQRFSSGAGDTSAQSTWTQRLSLHLADLDAAQISACMLWLLHRLRPDPSRPVAPFIADETYAAFAQVERATSYPHTAYDDHIRLSCHSDKTKLLDEVFDTMAAVVARADENGMTAVRACLLLGWWLLAIEENRMRAGWSDLYADWTQAGRTTQHLFLAWIRSQSHKSILPSRLEALVHDYPFQADVQSDIDTPTLPSSSTPRPALCIRLVTHQQIRRERDVGPRMLLDLSKDAASKKDQSLLANLFGQDQSASDVEELLSEGSKRFLRAMERREGDQEQRHGPRAEASSGAVLPAAKQSANSSTSGSSESRLPLRIARTPDQYPSGLLRSPSQSSNWDDFSKSGFADDSNELKSKLSFTTTLTTSQSPIYQPADASGGNARSKPVTPTAASMDAPRITCKIGDEHVTTVDENFVSFVEDSLLDTASCSLSRPAFAVFRLAESKAVLHNGVTTEIKLLLISLEYQKPAPPPPATTPPPPTSPVDATAQRSGQSVDASNRALTSSRRSFSMGLRELSFGRRPSLGGSAGQKRSMFGSIGRTRMSAPPERLQTPTEAHVVAAAPLAESGQSRSRAASLGPDQVIAEEPREPVQFRDTDPPVPTAFAVPADKSSEPLAAGTTPDEWKYLAEGGAHMVFAYVGDEPAFRSKVLRICKSADSSRVSQDAGKAWQDELLPKMLPADLLLRPEIVELPEDWLLRLISSAHLDRPEHRLLLEGQKFGRASMMDNLQSLEGLQARERIMAIEIKPKWGFMPDKRFIHPEEAVPIKSQVDRYTLHQALKRAQGEMANAYCPIDLYSRDEERVQRALGDLWTAWRETEGRSNNWRVCVDGKTVHPEDADLIPTARGGALSEATAPLILPLLAATGVLDLLKDLQQRLDPTDISDLANLFRAEHPDREVFDAAALPIPTEEELRAFVDLYLSDPQAGKQADAWTNRERYIAWALSAIFKDCSIMLRCVVKPVSEDHYELVREKSSVKLVDLDLKPVANLKKWYLLDEEIWRHWRDTHPSSESSGPAMTPDGDRQQASETSAKAPEEAIALSQPLIAHPIAGHDQETGIPAASDGYSRSINAPHHTADQSPIEERTSAPIETNGDTRGVHDNEAEESAGTVTGSIPAPEEETQRSPRPEYLQLSRSEPVVPVIPAEAAAASSRLDPPHTVANHREGLEGIAPTELRNPILDNLIKSEHVRSLESTPDLVSDHSSVASYFDAPGNAHPVSELELEDLDRALSDVTAPSGSPVREPTEPQTNSDNHISSEPNPMAFQLAPPIGTVESQVLAPEVSTTTADTATQITLAQASTEALPVAQEGLEVADRTAADLPAVDMTAVLQAAGPATASAPQSDLETSPSGADTIAETPR